MLRWTQILVVSVLGTSLALANISTNVPLYHWSYDAVDRLVQSGLIDSDMPGTRPYTRVEMAGLIVEAKERSLAATPLTRDVLKRLEDEFHYEVNLLESPGMTLSSGFLKPLEDPYVRLVYGKNTPSLENESGDVFSQGSNWRAGFATRGVFWERVALYLHPEYRNPWDSDTGAQLVEGYGKLGLGPMDIQLGKDNLWWGPGYHGAMIMSNNAEGFKMLKVSNGSPVLLPWLFRHLGPFKFVYFLTELEGQRYQPHARLTGIRIDIKPHPNVELGGSRTVMFGGDNFSNGIDDYLQIFWPMNFQGTENQLAALDASVRLPMPKKLPWRALKLYGEFAGEDAAGFSKYQPLLGLQVQDIGWRGSTDFRIEYAKTYNGKFHGVFYQHSQFQSGYTYKGRVIGHHEGTDARDIFARLQHYFTPNVIVGLDYDQQVLFPVQQTSNQYGVDLRWFACKYGELRARYRYEDIKRDPTRARWNHILDVGVTLNF